MEDWSVKLTDFGSSKKVDSTMTSGQGTVKWMAPEVLTSSNYNEKADIYSFSLIMWEVLMLQNFFTDSTIDNYSLLVPDQYLTIHSRGLKF